VRPVGRRAVLALEVVFMTVRKESSGAGHRRRRGAFGVSTWIGALGASVALTAVALAVIPTTRQNFYHPGTQPGALSAPGAAQLVSPSNCSFCHADYNEETAPYNRWAHSLHGQAARDPIFHAALAIAEQDAQFVGELCLRCHMPQAWVSNKVKFNLDPQSPDFGKSLELAEADLVGVACSVCHRMVDPADPDNVSPAADDAIIAALNNDALVPPVPGYPTVLANPHNAAMVLDTQDRRRGPFDLNADWNRAGLGGWPGFHQYLQSPFHLSSRMCATCHDVSTPHFTKQPWGAYTLNDPNTPPNPDKLMQFPEQRTFSEWSQSLFAQGPVNLGGRFGGQSNAYMSCQDCHMQTKEGQGCALEPPVRGDEPGELGVPQHNFTGANSWVLKAIREAHPDDGITGMSEQGVDQSIARSVQNLERASDLALSVSDGRLNVRITNFTGHKLPTGYNEGRRMWINVKFKDGNGNVIAERGAYDSATATLNESDTKVYEAKMGTDAILAAQLGAASGPSFHLALSNTYFKDNRIPPMGFTNANFEAVQAGSVPAYQYADGQYWDDTPFQIAPGARSAEVTVYHQTTTKEYVEFLRDANTDPNPATNKGQKAYTLWTMFGKSQPVVMDHAEITMVCRCNWDGNASLNIDDIFIFLNSWFAQNGDFDQNGVSNIDDIFIFLNCFFANCAGF
jgi:hypothetical protein